jgi:hypothetical protein
MYAYALAYGLDADMVRPAKREKNNEHAPRPFRTGLSTKLSRKLGFVQHGYLEGIGIEL